MRGVLIGVMTVLLIAGCGIARRESHSGEKSETARNAPAFCEVAKEMTWAARDTIESQVQIRAHNRNVRKHCRQEGSPNGKH